MSENPASHAATNGLEMWQTHSLEFLEMAFRSDRQARLEQPDGYARKTGECGDTVEFFLRVRDGRIAELCYDINGCMNTNATANTIIQMAEGKTLAEAWEITPEIVSAYLKSLPPDHFHCAELAAGAFYLALKDYERKSAGS